jgi:Flp pilus assembly pilin Flp
MLKFLAGAEMLIHAVIFALIAAAMIAQRAGGKGLP